MPPTQTRHRRRCMTRQASALTHDVWRAQYMPLESQEGANGEATQPLRAASNGGVGTV